MTIHFGSRAKVQCYRNLNLLGHAQIEEVEIGSRCGGYGECGGDRIRVTGGLEFLSAVTVAERKHLTQDELNAGYRLACQAFPQSDSAEIHLEPK
jgi:ferredoxin